MANGPNDPVARKVIFGNIRQSLGLGVDTAARREAVRDRLRRHPRNTIPARATAEGVDLQALFVTMAEAVSATVDQVDDRGAIPERIAQYLQTNNLPTRLRLAPDPAVTDLDWSSRPMLEVSSGPAALDDEVSVTGSFAGIAETGTLMLLSGQTHPTTLNFLPDTHIAIVDRARIVPTYEDAWDRLREHVGGERASLPRSVNLVTGPSRTGDIEQTIYLGAHGPRRVHLILAPGT